MRPILERKVPNNEYLSANADYFVSRGLFSASVCERRQRDDSGERLGRIRRDTVRCKMQLSNTHGTERRLALAILIRGIDVGWTKTTP